MGNGVCVYVYHLFIKQIQDFRKLEVWRLSYELTLDVYKITNEFPNNEQYGLVSQIRRATSSVPTNIAEGCGRFTGNEMKRFIHIAIGSASEVEYLLELLKDLVYIKDESYLSLSNKIILIRKKLINLNKKVRPN